MTARQHNFPLLGRIAILTALGATSIALIAASPADAIPRAYEPIDSEAPLPERVIAKDDTGKAGCSVTLSTGQSIVYPHGYSFSVVNKATGKTHTYTCEDGKWVETVNAVAPTTDFRYKADVAFVQDGTLVLADPQVAYGNAFYAEP